MSKPFSVKARSKSISVGTIETRGSPLPEDVDPMSAHLTEQCDDDHPGVGEYAVPPMKKAKKPFTLR